MVIEDKCVFFLSSPLLIGFQEDNVRILIDQRSPRVMIRTIAVDSRDLRAVVTGVAEQYVMIHSPTLVTSLSPAFLAGCVVRQCAGSLLLS